MLRPDLARRLDALVGLRRRHADVDDRHVRVVAAHLQQQLVGGPGLADDLDPGLGQQPRQALPQQRRVLGDHRPQAVIVGPDVPERRKVLVQIVGEQLEDLLGLRQPPELEGAEVDRRRLDQARRRLRGQHLPTVAGLTDARRAVDVDADVGRRRLPPRRRLNAGRCARGRARPTARRAPRSAAGSRAPRPQPPRARRRRRRARRRGSRPRGRRRARRHAAAARGPRRARRRRRRRGARRGRSSPRCR